MGRPFEQLRHYYKHATDLMQKWRLIISINLILSTKEIKPNTKKSVPKLLRQPRFRAVGQTHAEWQTFGKPVVCVTNFDMLFLVIGSFL